MIQIPRQAERRQIDILKEEVGVRKIQNFGIKKQFSFKQNTFLHQNLVKSNSYQLYFHSVQYCFRLMFLFKCFKLKFHVLRGVSKNSKFSQFQIFPKLGTGVVVKFQFFPKFKKVQIILGEGSRKLWTFSTFWDIFLIRWLP